MSSFRVGCVCLALTATFVAIVSACSGGSSDAPPQANPGLPCLAYPLQAYCCGDASAVAPTCIGDFASAQKCTTWPADAKLRVYPADCHGFTAVALGVDGYTSLSVYSSSTGTLYAIGDDAATNDPGSLAAECGAGPQNFTLPTDCAAMWLDDTQGEPCATGTSTPSSVCH